MILAELGWPCLMVPKIRTGSNFFAANGLLGTSPRNRKKYLLLTHENRHRGSDKEDLYANLEHLTVSLYLCSSGSNACGKVEGALKYGK